MRCCGSCRSGGHLSLRQRVPARFSAEYREWLRVQRGLAPTTVDALMWEARHFLSWYTERPGVVGFIELSIRDIDDYFKMRAPGLRRKSRKDVAERLRSLMRFLHITGRIGADLAPQIIESVLGKERLPGASIYVASSPVAWFCAERRSRVDARHRRVHPPLPHPCAVRRLPSHPPLWSLRQRLPRIARARQLLDVPPLKKRGQAPFLPSPLMRSDARDSPRCLRA